MKGTIIKSESSKGVGAYQTLDQKNNSRITERITKKGNNILNPKETPLSGWKRSFRKMHKNQDDKPLIADLFENENFE